MSKLSEQEYRLRQGLPATVESVNIPKLLLDMIDNSMGVSSVAVEVEVLGTVETQDLQLQVRPKVTTEVI